VQRLDEQEENPVFRAADLGQQSNETDWQRDDRSEE